MVLVREYLISRINNCCVMPVTDFLWMLDNTNFDNPSARDAIKEQLQISPNLTKLGWQIFINTATFLPTPVRDRASFLDQLDYGKIDCNFLKDFINSIDLGVSVLEAPIEQRTIIRNYIVNCDLGKLPEFMLRADYTNADGLIRANMIEAFNVFNIVEASEETLPDFIANVLNYQFSENDLILLDSDSDNMYFYTGGDKFSLSSYRKVNFGSVSISNVIGLSDALDGKLDIDGLNLNTIDYYNSLPTINIPVGTFAKDANGVPYFFDGNTWIKFGGSEDRIISLSNRLLSTTFEGALPSNWDLISAPETIDEFIDEYQIKVLQEFNVLIPFERIYNYTNTRYWYLTFKYDTNNVDILNNLRFYAISSAQPTNEIEPTSVNVTTQNDLAIVRLQFTNDFQYADFVGIEVENNLPPETYLTFGYFQFNELQASLFDKSNQEQGGGVKMTGQFQVGTLFNGEFE